MDLTYLDRASPGFPQPLADIPDPPQHLWVRGLVSALGRPSVAIVGSRRASPGSLEIARRLAADLARIGLTIISGLARRAYGRPVTKLEIDELVAQMDRVKRRGDSPEEQLVVGIQAILISPNFLFRIENDQVLNLLRLELRPGSYRYSLIEIGKNFKALKQELDRVKDIDPKQRDLFDVKVAELGSHLRVYEQLSQRDVPLVQPVPGQAEQKWLSLRQADFEAMAPATATATSR